MQQRLNFAPLPGDPGKLARGDNASSGTEELQLPQPEDQSIRHSVSNTAPHFQDINESQATKLLVQLARETDTTSTLYYDLDREDDSESHSSCSDQDDE